MSDASVREAAAGGRVLSSLETPALLIERSILETNLRAAADLAARHDIALRPHWKTHKCLEIARLQEEAGAVGGTVAKPGEAEVFLAAGFRDVRVATTVVAPTKIDRLLAARGDAALSVIVESAAGREAWSAAAARVGRPVPVLLEVDVGMGRTGVLPADAVEAARALHASPGLAFAGVLTHAGHGYQASSYEDRAAIGRSEGETLVRVARAIREPGIPCDEVSVGSTPTAEFSAAIPGVTEVRPGNSVFHDGIQVDLGVVGIDRCALTVLATVVARPARDRVVLDCGSKTLSSDVGGAGAAGGFGRVLDRPELRLARLSEEHGILPVPEDSPLSVGDRLRIVPNHACATTNLHERFVVADGESVTAEWSIAARGRID